MQLSPAGLHLSALSFRGKEEALELNDAMCPLAAMLEVHCVWQQQLRTADPICRLMTRLPQQYRIDDDVVFAVGDR